jgi:hypothetical protein
LSPSYSKLCFFFHLWFFSTIPKDMQCHGTKSNTWLLRCIEEMQTFYWFMLVLTNYDWYLLNSWVWFRQEE